MVGDSLILEYISRLEIV
jgi:hypothetical protein